MSEFVRDVLWTIEDRTFHVGTVCVSDAKSKRHRDEENVFHAREAIEECISKVGASFWDGAVRADGTLHVTEMKPAERLLTTARIVAKAIHGDWNESLARCAAMSFLLHNPEWREKVAGADFSCAPESSSA